MQVEGDERDGVNIVSMRRGKYLVVAEQSENRQGSVQAHGRHSGLVYVEAREKLEIVMMRRETISMLHLKLSAHGEVPAENSSLGWE
jgi:hypothetical protein